jgi:type I restriction enzyme, S subunit
MSSDWEIKKLKEIGEVVTGKTPSGKIDNAYDGEVLFLTPRDLTNEKVTLNTERTLSNEGINDVANYLLPKNSVSVSCIGSDLGKVTIIGKEAVTNQQINSIIVNDEVNHEYVYYDLSLRQNELKSIAGGSATPIINKSSFSEIEIKLPSLSVQDQIVAQLAPLDQKIHLNQQANQTLEEMAQAIFKSWFVDFDPVRAKIEARSAGRDPNRAAMAAIAGVSLEMDWDEIDTALQHKLDRMTEPQRIQLRQTAQLFPDELVKSEIGVVPKGWEVKAIDDVAEVIDCLHSKKPERQDHGNIYLEVSNIGKNGNLDLSDKYFINEDDYKLWTKRIEVTKGDMVITKTGRVGALAYIPKGIKAAIGRNIVAIRPDQNVVNSSFLRDAMLSDFMKREISGLISSGTILQSLHVKAVRQLRLIIPNDELIAKYSESISEIHEMISGNIFQNESLSGLRDILLPKLISGELVINKH